MQTALTHKTENSQKVLRLGVIENGRIVEERIISRAIPVTVGRGSKNLVLLGSAGAPESLPLIDVHRGAHVLRFKKGMYGKVACGGQVIDLRTAARRGLAESRKGEYRLPLRQEISGKVKVGDSTMLFQFVNAPAQAKAEPLPKQARGSWVKSWDRPMISCFLAVALLLGGGGLGMEAWWNQTGKYLQVTRKPSTRMLDSIKNPQQVVVQDPQDTPDPDQPVIDPRGVINDPDLVEPKPEKPQGTIINPPDLVDNGAENPMDRDPAVAVGPPASTQVDVDVAIIAKKIDVAYAVPAVASGFPSKPPATGVSPRRGTTGTVVEIVHTNFGPGKGISASGSSIVRRGFEVASGTGLEIDGGSGEVHREFGLADAAEAADAHHGSHPGLPAGVPLVTHKADVELSKLERQIAGQKAPSSGISGVGKTVEMKAGKKGYALERRGDKTSRSKTTSASVSQHVRGRQSALGRCYFTAARRNPNVGNLLKIKVYVNKKGKARVVIVRDKTNDPSIARCVSDKIEGWKFPNNTGGRLVAEIPLVFRKM